MLFRNCLANSRTNCGYIQIQDESPFDFLNDDQFLPALLFQSHCRTAGRSVNDSLISLATARWVRAFTRAPLAAMVSGSRTSHPRTRISRSSPRLTCAAAATAGPKMS